MNKMNAMIAGLVLSLLMAGTALAKDIVIFNGTNFNIPGLYMSATDDTSWGENLLGEDILKPGEGMKITVSGAPKDLDLAVVDDEGQEMEFRRLDFSDFGSLTLYTDGTGRFE